MIIVELNRDEIESLLEKLPREKVLQFAWRCAVRAFPFLGARGNFDCWEEEKRQGHMYSVIRALDYAAAADAAYAAADAAAAAELASADAAAAEVAVATTAVAAAAAELAYDAYLATAAVAVAVTERIKVIEAIHKDLAALENDIPFSPSPEPAELYGPVWGNFQRALEGENCGYWGRLYTAIFENNLEVDEEALKLRLSVPAEIQAQGAAKVAAYLMALEEKGATNLKEARVVILGEKGAGKTSLARRLLDPEAPMPGKDESTEGVDTDIWKVESEDLRIHVWDFAGHVVTHAAHRFFLSERCLYIIVYDGRTETRNRLEYWLDHVKNYGGDSRVLVVVNKFDDHLPDLRPNTLKDRYPENFKGREDIASFSIQDDAGALKAFRARLVQCVKDSAFWNREVISTNYYQVKRDIEDLFDRTAGANGGQPELICRKKFTGIAQAHGVACDKEEELLSFLHCLGASLWYNQGKLKGYDQLVLNPSWISHAVYRIINWLNTQQRHEIKRTDFMEAFQKESERFPEATHPFIFDLAQHYELAYASGQAENARLLFPHLMREDRPDELPAFDIADSLMLRYKADSPLPPDTVSRFIVRQHTMIHENKVWRYGVVLRNANGCLAQLQEDERNPTLTLKVRGERAAATAFISELRGSLENIFSTYQSKRPDLQYQLDRSGPEEWWSSERDVLAHGRVNRPLVNPNNNEEFSANEAARQYGIRIETLNVARLNLASGPGGRIEDYSTTIHASCGELQQVLSPLIKELEAVGCENPEVLAEFKELEDGLTKVQKLPPEAVRESGLLDKVKRFASQIKDSGSAVVGAMGTVEDGLQKTIKLTNLLGKLHDLYQSVS